MKSKKEYGYVGNYLLATDQPLRYELARKVKGISHRNINSFLVEVFGKVYFDLKLQDLTEEQLKNLQSVLVKGYLVPKKTILMNTNSKARVCTKEHLQISNEIEGVSYYVFGTEVKSKEAINKKRLVKSGCYIGLRHKLFRRVHGQRTKSTNRKNKVLKGFQRNKKQISSKKEESSKSKKK
jgi:ribosomal protein S13